MILQKMTAKNILYAVQVNCRYPSYDPSQEVDRSDERRDGTIRYDLEFKARIVAPSRKIQGKNFLVFWP
jgi:hypothetical protein